ncbi:AAA family ATPase [Geminicoccus roseus]|uniref:AAA family ATPase n=1 Tax=Geminicoccus roseus TaxID=404900 RepID=UPI0004114EFF|nr:AAA family ATPase [Geminicoccus roseus]
MQLTRIVIHGFKSFADRVELALEPGLTGIVGPNGCGKSNIVDALRWVSGEASARGVRGDDMDDVIFAGTGRRPGRELADVMVMIEGDLSDYARHATDGRAEVRRTITRGHGSTFRIAGREVRARDVQRLFQDAGAGARGTAIVAQGQVQAVTEAKPEDRRRFLEEAAGVGGLQSRKREAESKLLQTEGNLARIADLIGALQARMEQLTRQAAQAERYKKLAHELREAEAALALARLLDARFRLEQAAAAARAADQEAEKAEIAHQSDLRRLQAAENAAETAREHLARLVPRHAALAERVAARRAEADRAQADAADLASRLEAAIREQAEAEQRLATLAAERELLAAEAADARQVQAERSAALPGLEEAAQAALHERTRAEAAALAARERRFEAEAILARARDRHEGLVQVRARAEAALQAARQRLASLIPPEQDPQADELQRRQEALRTELAAAEGAQPETADRLAAAESKLARVQAEREALGQALPALERRRGELLEQRQRLERRLAALADRRTALERQRQDHIRGSQAIGDRPEDAAARAGAALLQARRHLQDSEQALSDARTGLSEAETERTGKLAAASAAASGLARLEQEARELAKVLPPVRADEVIAAIAVAEDLAAALAAALGEGLTASLDPLAPRHWLAGEAPPAPEAAELAHLPKLAERVRVPPALARAMSLVWLAEPAEAARLQRHLPGGGALVSPDGGLWRWDGYVRLPGARDAAALLLAQRDRLERLTVQLDADRPAVAALDAERQAADQAVAAARTQLGQREQAMRQARSALEQAERAAAAALAADQAWQRRRVELDEAAARIEALAGTLRDDQAEADTEQAALVDPAATEAELRQARARQAELAAALQQAQAERSGARQDGERLAATIARLRKDLAGTVDAVRAAEVAFQEERTRIIAERATVEAAQARHEAELADALAGLGPSAEEFQAATTTLAELRTSAQAAEKTLNLAREQADRAERALGDAGTELRLVQERAVHRDERRQRLDAEAEQLGRAIASASRAASELAGRAASAEAEARRLGGEAEALVAALAAEAQAVEGARAAADAADFTTRERRDALTASERSERSAALRAAETRTARQAAHAALAALKEELSERFADHPLPEPDPAIATAPVAELEERARRLRSSRDRLGAVNLLAAEEAVAAREEFERLTGERAELEEAAARLVKAVRSLDGEARQRLLDQFAVVERHFEDLFTRLFNGGNARLRLTDPSDPLKGGLELEASPPGKKLTSLSLMSGGEKALTALCLIFAFFLAHPSPLCVLDEVDAPLDDANVGRLIDLVQEIASRTGTRFLVVTHHPLTMARMDRLYGVTMVERGVSRLVSVELGRAIEMRRTA